MVAELIAGKNDVHPVARSIAGCTYCQPQVASSA
jgi:pyruvate/2-oxoglutarate dehydrogenase complex dihydrolipoamide dehydrogenase (E3) component